MAGAEISQTMTFHVVGLPHTQTTLEYESCPFTSKVRKFCNMMKSLGHTVYLYASEENEAACDKLITIATKQDQNRWFGDNNFKKDFYNISWSVGEPHWVETNNKAIDALKKNLNQKDFICLIGGVCQKDIADAFPAQMTVELGIGYVGPFAPFRVYEAYSHMHYIHGLEKNDNGRFFDAVIPNYFELENFPYKQKRDDYFLFLGRFTERKGIQIAAEATRRAGKRLVIAGQGVTKIEGNTIIGPQLTISGDHIEHVGYADVKKRAKLLSNAQGVFMTTTYLEPFGAVAVESMLCGTPVIATDFGAFPELVQHGVHGYRFRTIGEAVWAVNNVNKLDKKTIRDYAQANFSTERVKYQYQAYFEQLLTLWDGDGFNSDWNAGVAKYQRYQRQ